MNTWDTNSAANRPMVTAAETGTVPYVDGGMPQQQLQAPYHPRHSGHHEGQKGGNKHNHHPRSVSGNGMAVTPTSSNGPKGDSAVAPGVRKQFLRTKLCKHFLRGCCLYGDKCTYAHDYSQIQVRPDLRKTKMCQANLEGRCPYKAEDCQFAHSTEDLKATPGLFKTVLCSWWQKGKCDMGDKCRFAHGEAELQRPSVPSGPEDVSITPGTTPLQNPVSEEGENGSIHSGEGSRPSSPPGLQHMEDLPPVSHVPTPPQMQQQQPTRGSLDQTASMPAGAYPSNEGMPRSQVQSRGPASNIFTPPPEVAVSPAEVLKYQQNQFATVLSGSLAAAAQAAAMQQRPTQDPAAYAAQQQQQWAIAAAAATAATAAVASIAGGFEPTPAQLQNLSLAAARSLHQQAAMQQMYLSYTAQQQQAMFVQQQAAAALAAQQWQQQQMAQQQRQQQQQDQHYGQYVQQQQQQYGAQKSGQATGRSEPAGHSLHTSTSASRLQGSSENADDTSSSSIAMSIPSDQQVTIHAPMASYPVSVETPGSEGHAMQDYPSSSSLTDLASGTATDASVTEFGDVAAPLPNIKSSAAILGGGSGLRHVASMSIPQPHLNDDDGDGDMASTSNLMKAFASSPALCTVGSLLGLANQAEPLSAEEEAEFAEFGALSELYSQDPSVQAGLASPAFHTSSSKANNTGHHSLGGLAQSASFNCFPSLLASVGESSRPRAGSDPAMHGHDDDTRSSDALFAELQNLVSSQNHEQDSAHAQQQHH
ncbi:hypothetical protein FOL47_009446 [Perkinsus chesapeaki]|uniref:C3H1-type domain-containing protein n=1 Tax=Perkinsus chesapeaki TaxID=330153 RepID=A0A7J6MRT5_PERCH|nr:hypothetical protein FOL47_009446 [Perkinsus chesapeaki]